MKSIPNSAQVGRRVLKHTSLGNRARPNPPVAQRARSGGRGRRDELRGPRARSTCEAQVTWPPGPAGASTCGWPPDPHLSYGLAGGSRTPAVSRPRASAVARPGTRARAPAITLSGTGARAPAVARPSTGARAPAVSRPGTRRRAAPARAARCVGRPTAPLLLLLLVPLGEEVVQAPLLGLGHGRCPDGWGRRRARRSRFGALGQGRLCAQAAGCGVALAPRGCRGAGGRAAGSPRAPRNGGTLLARAASAEQGRARPAA